MDYEQGSLLRKPKPLKLYKALKLTYEPSEQKRQKALKKYGYILDKELSTPETLVAYNPFKKDLLYGVRGTNLRNEGHLYENKDIQTDLLLGLGAFEQTKRYENEKNTLLKARKKYDEDKVILYGHSMGGLAAEVLPVNPQDKVYTYNAPILKPRKGRKNVQHLRTEGDIFSAFNPEAKTLQNENPVSANLGGYILGAHKLENLVNEAIFI